MNNDTILIRVGVRYKHREPDVSWAKGLLAGGAFVVIVTLASLAVAGILR